MLKNKTLLLIYFLSLIATIKVNSQIKYFKGNLHAHTSYSDGSLSFNEVVKKYSDLKYDFLSITDHNKFINLKNENISDKMLVLEGEEITFYNHVTALNIQSLIIPSLNSSLQSIIDEVNKQNGIPILSHPTDSTKWYSDIKFINARRLLGVKHMEIYNAVNNTYSLNLWDSLLTSQQLYYGVVCDDSHQAQDIGKAWIMVRANQLTPNAILASIRNGDYYSSTGVTIKPINNSKEYIEIISEENNIRFRFIGKNGKTLQEEKKSNLSRYYFRGDEKYVRVELTNALGQKAWTNPVFLESGIISDTQRFDSQKEKFFSVYPNPSNSVFNLMVDSEIAEIKIYDLLGREIPKNAYSLKRNSQYAFQIEMAKMSSNLYLLFIHTRDTIFTSKLILLK